MSSGGGAVTTAVSAPGVGVEAIVDELMAGVV